MSGGTSQHAGNADAQWRALVIEPDLCRVGKSIIGFSSFAALDQCVTHSPNVYADGERVYRVDDIFRTVQADAGRHIVAGTSRGSGHVRILAGQDDVKLNGLPVARHGSACMVNCNAQGIGGARGTLVSELKPTPRSVWQRMADESGKVLSDAWNGFKQTTSTVWEALPWTSDAATTAAARSRIADGVMGSLQGIGTLMGPDPSFVQAAYLSGNEQSIALVQQMQASQQQAAGALVDSVGQSWRDAQARSGRAGAMAMVGTNFVVEALGGKGVGAIAKVAERIQEISNLAKSPLDAARMLSDELSAARKAGAGPDELKLLEEARVQKLAEARASSGGAGGDGGDAAGRKGVYVRATRVPCFHPYDKAKFKRMAPDQQRAYLDEMAAQLRRQQEAINDMTASQFKAAREAFAKHGRNPTAEGAQEDYRTKFSNSVITSIQSSLRDGGMSPSSAERLAKQRTEELMSKLSALHEPDMVAGGWLKPDPQGMGRADVNSSIGGSWPQRGRASTMDNAAKDAIAAGHGERKMNVQLEVCRGRGLR